MTRDRSFAGRVGATLAAVLVAGLSVTLTATEASAQPAASIQLTGQTTWVRDDDTFEVTVAVGSPPEGKSLDVEIYSAVEARRDLAETFDTDNLGSEVFGRERPLAELPSDGFSEYTFSLPVADIPLDSTEGYGVYPVVVQLKDGGTTMDTLVTYLLLLPDAADAFPPLSVGVVMDLGTTTPGIQPDGVTSLTTEEFAALRDRVEILTETAQLPTGPLPLTIAPEPETLDAVGLSGGEEADSLLSELRQALLPGREALGLPYVDLDLRSLAAANLLDQVPPERDMGLRTTRRWLQGAAEPVPDVWATQASIDPAAADALSGLGIPRAIVPSSAVESVPDHPNLRTPTAPVNLTEGGPLAIVTDDALGERLLGQEGVVDGQRFLAELTLIWNQAEDEEQTRAIAVRLSGTEPLDRALVDHALGGLSPEGTDGFPILQAATASDLMGRTPLDGEDGEPAVVEVAPAETPADDLATLQPAMAQAEAVVSGLAGTLTDKVLIDQLYRSLRIAPGYTTPNDQRMSYVRQVDEERDALATAVNAPAGFTITLTARDGTIPLQIGNTSDQVVTVKVHLSSSQLEFPDGSTFQMELPPAGDSRNVPVRSRTSGAFRMRVTITSPDDQVIFDRRTFTIRSTAISGVGLLLSIGAGLFLLIWWARHWRTARRAEKLVPEHAVGRRHGVR